MKTTKKIFKWGFILCMITMVLNLPAMFICALITQSNRLPDAWVIFNISNLGLLFFVLFGLLILNFKKIVTFVKETTLFDE